MKLKTYFNIARMSAKIRIQSKKRCPHFISDNIVSYFVISALTVLAGCQSTLTDNTTSDTEAYPIPFYSGSVEIQETANAPLSSYESIVNEYVFSPGDTFDVKFFYTPELNETLVIRPDGQISLQIIGDIEAAGKTPSQLRELLKLLYSPHLKNPEISVIVRSFSNQRIFVGGQVMKPGTIEMSDKMTVLEAILEAGGIDYRQAQLKNIVVIRYHNGKRFGYKLDMKPVLEGKQCEPFFLEPKDIVYVPRTKIAEVNQWIDQHINKIVPQTGFYLIQRRGDTTIGIDTSSRY